MEKILQVSEKCIQNSKQ